MHPAVNTIRNNKWYMGLVVLVLIIAITAFMFGFSDTDINMKHALYTAGIIFAGIVLHSPAKKVSENYDDMFNANHSPPGAVNSIPSVFDTQPMQRQTRPQTQSQPPPPQSIFRQSIQPIFN